MALYTIDFDHYDDLDTQNETVPERSHLSEEKTQDSTRSQNNVRRSGRVIPRVVKTMLPPSSSSLQKKPIRSRRRQTDLSKDINSSSNHQKQLHPKKNSFAQSEVPTFIETYDEHDENVEQVPIATDQKLPPASNSVDEVHSEAQEKNATCESSITKINQYQDDPVFIEPVCSSDYQNFKDSFTLIRLKKFGISGSKFTYYLKRDSNVIYTAFNVGKHPRVVSIADPDSRLSRPLFVLIVANEAQDFSLRAGNENGTEFLTIRYDHSDERNFARDMRVFIFLHSRPYPYILRTKQPSEKTTDGKPLFNFDDLPQIPSIKNTILSHRTKDPDLIFIRKIDDNTVVLDTKIELHAIYVFALLLCSVISPVK